MTIDFGTRPLTSLAYEGTPITYMDPSLVTTGQLFKFKKTQITKNQHFHLTCPQMTPLP